MTDQTVVSGSAVDAIAQLARDGQAPRTIEIGEYTYAIREAHDERGLARVDVDPAMPVPLEFYTLKAFADYLVAEGEDDVFVHVVSPRQVDAVSRLLGEDKALRRIPARALLKTAITGFTFGGLVTMEALNIALQTCFEPERGQIDGLREFCASVRSTQEVGVDDDGVSQTVQARSGIVAIQTTKVKNPWSLAPWRTFPEIDQPQSPFVLRFKEGEAPFAGLFETGDQQWQIEAVKSIAVYLRTLLGEDWKVLG